MTQIARRSLAGLLAAGTVAATLPASARLAGPIAAPPPLARFSIGLIRVTAMSDGFIDAPVAAFTGAAPAEIADAFAARGIRETARLGFTAWLIEDGERRLLIDAGGAGFVPTAGRLPAAFRALGIDASDIDMVAATHVHVDHINGLVAGGRAAFPRATVFAPRADVGHFTDPARRAAATDLQRGSYDATEALVRLYPRLQRFDGRQALLPGVETVDLAGHTPGQTGYRISDAGDSLLIVGDALFDPALHPGRADIGIAFEEDAPAARAMRSRLFAMAAGEGTRLAATHMPFPGVGRIVRDGGALRWVAEDFPYAA
jgi:glyoxylase-like metal-dependent hydrolase (beta-lactamase superfamily II)